MRAIVLTIFLVIITFPGSFGQETGRQVVAERGDGIYILLKRYGLQPSEFLSRFIELNKDDLGRNNTLVAGRRYLLPYAQQSADPEGQSSSARKYPIFGKKYEIVVTKNEILKGACYYLVSGHGGPDPGAMGKYENHTLCEDEYAYDVTIRLARNLIENGATVYMITRDPDDGIRDESFLAPDKDEVCYPDQTIPLNQLKRLDQRKEAVNKLYREKKGAFQRMIAIHVDSRSHRQNIDVFFYHDKQSKTGQKAATILQQTFQTKYEKNQPGRGYSGTVSARNLYELKNTIPVAVYIELGNINHLRDQQRFIVTNNRQAVANWLTEGLIEDFRNNK